MSTHKDSSHSRVKAEKPHIRPHLQEVLSTAQREQSTAFKQFFAAWRRAKERPNSQKQPTRAAVSAP